MLNYYQQPYLRSFSADVFMCEHHQTASGLGYWLLRLLTQNTLIDAYHWDKEDWPIVEYKDNDTVLVGGRWTTQNKARFQVMNAQILTRTAANDASFTDIHQLEFNFTY